MAYTSTSLFIIKGSQDRNSNRARTWRQELTQRPWRGATYWLAPHGLLSLLSYRTQDHLPGMAPPIVGVAFSHHWLRKCLTPTFHEDILSTETPSSLVTLASSVKWTEKQQVQSLLCSPGWPDPASVSKGPGSQVCATICCLWWHAHLSLPETPAGIRSCWMEYHDTKTF